MAGVALLQNGAGPAPGDRGVLPVQTDSRNAVPLLHFHSRRIPAYEKTVLHGVVEQPDQQQAAVVPMNRVEAEGERAVHGVAQVPRGRSVADAENAAERFFLHDLHCSVPPLK